MKVSQAVTASLVALGAALTLAQSTQPQDEKYAPRFHLCAIGSGFVYDHVGAVSLQ